MEAGTILRPSSPTDNFIFATYLDRLGELACSSVRSAIANGVELAILACVPRRRRYSVLRLVFSSQAKRWRGVGRDNPSHPGHRLNDGGAGFLHERDPKRRKVSALRAFLQHFSNDTLIVFSDGTDVLYTPTARGTWARLFRDFDLNKPNSVVFGAERNCWPMMDGARNRHTPAAGRGLSHSTADESAALVFCRGVSSSAARSRTIARLISLPSPKHSLGARAGDRELQPGGRERCGLLEPARGAYSSFRYINAGNWIARRDVADRSVRAHA